MGFPFGHDLEMVEPPGGFVIFIWQASKSSFGISLFGGSPSFKLFISKFSELGVFKLIYATLFFLV